MKKKKLKSFYPEKVRVVNKISAYQCHQRHRYRYRYTWEQR